MSIINNKLDFNLAKTFCDLAKQGKYILTPPELNGKKSLNIYKSYIDYVIDSKPHEFAQNSFKTISQNDFLEYLLKIILLIFGNNENIFAISDEFVKAIVFVDEETVLEGIKLTIHNKLTKEKKNVIGLPKIMNTATIVTAVHEFIHFYIEKENIDLKKKYYYEEILSIFSEKVATYVIQDIIGLQDDMVFKIENTRLSTIVWHYKTKHEEMQEAMKLYKIMKNIYSKEQLDIINQDLPWLNDSKLIAIYNTYQEQLSLGYGFGYLYAEALYSNLTNNPEAVLGNIRGFFFKDIDIDGLLKIYNVGINPQTLVYTKRRVNDVTNKNK